MGLQGSVELVSGESGHKARPMALQELGPCGPEGYGNGGPGSQGSQVTKAGVLRIMGAYMGLRLWVRQG